MRPTTLGRVHTGGAATIGRTARLVLLACTLLCLAAMHTIGHGGVSHSAHHSEPQLTMTHQLLLMDEPAPGESDGCAGDGCARAAALPGSAHGGMGGWDVCVAVLSALAIAVLLAALLLIAVTGRFPPLFGGDRRRRTPRGPPLLPFGLTLATVSVLRT